MLPWLFFFFFSNSFCLFLITFILPVYYAMEIFYSFSFSILVSLDIYIKFPFYFSEDLQKEIGNFFLTFFFADIFPWKKFPITSCLITSYSLLSCLFLLVDFKLPYFFLFLASWTHSMLSSLFILSAFVHFLSFLCFIFRLLLLT